MTAVPFVIGQWVRGERFYGRRRIIEESLNGPREALWIVGTRRIGKTSLLKELERLSWQEAERRYFPLYWDLQGADDPAELDSGFTEALLDAEERLEEVGIGAAELETADMFRALGRLRRSLRKRGLRLLLLCDEVEELVGLNEKHPALLGRLRHALLASEDVRSVLASTLRLSVLTEQGGDTSPFLHGFSPPLYLATLEDDEARSLVRQDHLPEAARPAFDETGVEALCERAGRHPFLLQLVAKRWLESGDLEEAVAEAAADQMVSYFFSVDFEMLAPVARAALRTVAVDEATSRDTLAKVLGVPAAQLTGPLQTLQNLGLLERRDDQSLGLANTFFRGWLSDLAPASPISSATEFAETRRTSRAWPEQGTVLDGRYELRRQVGEGATGVVFEAWDRLLETRLAIKLLRAEYAGNRLVLERFRQEILLARNLGHPNILRLYHLGEDGHRVYLTMQWVDGVTLAEEIASEAPLALERIAFLGGRVASALEAAHAHQVLHRDIKPQNILVDPRREPLVSDFGLARWLGGPGVTTAGVFLGTPNYVSPEQARLAPVDERSDLYSLGVVLFEMATGICPFRGESAAEVLEMHRTQEAPDPRETRPDLSADLAEIISRCLEKDPQRRVQTATELRQALERLLPGGALPPHSAAAVSRPAATPGEAPGPGEPAGDREAKRPPCAEDLLPLVYTELRRLARGFLARERPDHTLQPTALVHEAYLRLAEQSRVEWAGRSHFLAIGARVMRRLLIDHARSRARLKRGGEVQRITLLEGLTPDGDPSLGLEELLALDAALDELARENERWAQIVELRFFGGSTVADVAQQLGLSKRTVEADWAKARAWLARRLA